MIRRLLDDRRGVSAVEYALLLAALLLVFAGGYHALGRKNVKPTNASTDELKGGTGYIAGTGPGASGGGGTGNVGGGPGGVVCDGRSCGAPGGNCFVAGTPVWTPSGERPIESLVEGDIVFSRDEASAAIKPRRVLRTFTRRTLGLVAVTMASAQKRDTLRVTAEHRFWTGDRGWVEAAFLATGEPLVDLAGDVVRVVSVVPLDEEAVVYNFEVEETHTYFVGHTATWVHNACDPVKPVFDGLTGGGSVHLSPQTFMNYIASGALPPDGTGTFAVNPSNGAITLQQPSWFGPPTFTGQYVGLLTKPDGSVPHNLDTNAQVIFTDNLTGCAVIVSQTAQPQLLHIEAPLLGADPTTYNATLVPYMYSQGMDNDGNPSHGIPPPLVVKADDYGWVIGGGDYGPGLNQPHNAQAFLYGVKDDTGHRQWWLLKVNALPNNGGYQHTTIPVGTTLY
ncbi:HINT domain-containing protein [Pendulispora rubella]|uniref:HINT domain-containing protein n=1 Tax=Pendulispora rubella TaxID=2741070 RepID=A0ABZ2LBZ7_9BACT